MSDIFRRLCLAYSSGRPVKGPMRCALHPVQRNTIVVAASCQSPIQMQSILHQLQEKCAYAMEQECLHAQQQWNRSAPHDHCGCCHPAIKGLALGERMVQQRPGSRPLPRETRQGNALRFLSVFRISSIPFRQMKNSPPTRIGRLFSMEVIHMRGHSVEWFKGG